MHTFFVHILITHSSIHCGAPQESVRHPSVSATVMMDSLVRLANTWDVETKVAPNLLADM